jgi:superoxide reductase
MKINRYEDISQIEREAKRDYIDRHSAFVHVDGDAQKGEKYKVKVQVGDEYAHPDDFDHYISYVQLWDGEKMLAQTNFTAGALGSAAGQVEVDFYIVPSKSKLKLTAAAFCTKHGLWQSDEKVVEVVE